MPFRLAILLLVCAPSAWADVPRPIPDPPLLSAVSYLLMDYHSGRVLVEHNADKRVEPASLTKMMTSYIVSDELRKGSFQRDDEVLISEKAWRMGGSKMFIEVDKRVSVDDLIQGMIIQSGNDASVALAEYVAGSEASFSDLMNAYAAHLGLSNSEFANSTGMPARQHYTTAYDMAILAKALIRDFPEDYALYSEDNFTFNDITQKNRNALLTRDRSVDGIKTGHTESSGYSLVASAERDGMRLISVVMGTKSDEKRSAETERLLAYGYRFFETRKLFDRSKQLENLKVWMGETDSVAVGVADDVYVTIARGDNNIKTQAQLRANLTAPVEAGQVVGSLTVYSGEDVIAEQDVIAQSGVAEGGLWEKARDTVLQLLPW